MKYTVMVETEHGWLQVSPMYTHRALAESYQVEHLSNSRQSSLARDGATTCGGEISIAGKLLKIFEIR